MKLFVGIKTDIAPEVRIDHGGGEIGSATLVGASFEKESVEKACIDDLHERFILDNIASEEGLTFDEYKENSASYYVRYDIEECDLIRDNLKGNY